MINYERRIANARKRYELENVEFVGKVGDALTLLFETLDEVPNLETVEVKSIVNSIEWLLDLAMVVE